MGAHVQHTDSEHISPQALFDFFRSRVDGLSPASQKNYRTTIGSLRSFAESQGNGVPFMSAEWLEEWLLGLSMKGLSIKTIRLYFDIASALATAAVKEGLLTTASAFDILRPQLAKISNPATDIAADYKRFISQSRVIRLSEADRMAVDMALMSLLAGCMPLSRVAMLTKDDISETNADIAARHAEPRRKYIFPLGQSLRTQKQVVREAETPVAQFMSRYQIGAPGSTPDGILQSLWAYGALCCGATGAMVLSCLGVVPEGLPLLSLCEAAAVTATERESLIDAVGRLFLHNPKRWFAMRLRRGVTPADIRTRLTGGGREVPEIFYPCDEIARRVGRRLVMEQEPVLPQVAFFKSRLSDILPLFAVIGDLAWCFKSSLGVGAHYAPIPAAETERFQRTIGHFTAEYEVAGLGHLELRPGDRVKIVGGIYAGRDGTIEGIDHSDPTTVYRLLLTAESGIEWRTRIDSRLLLHG